MISKGLKITKGKITRIMLSKLICELHNSILNPFTMKDRIEESPLGQVTYLMAKAGGDNSIS